jgi:hypothetical protein
MPDHGCIPVYKCFCLGWTQWLLLKVKTIAMYLTGKIIFTTCLLSCLLQLQAQEDTVLNAKDSVIEKREDCMGIFFRRSPDSASSTKTLVVTKAGKTVTLKQFMKTGDMDDNAAQVLADLDNDGKKELVLNNFTGGAHCCDELYIFRNIAADKYQYVARLFAGNTCITDSNLFIYDFYEQFGYFFTCFACAYTDTSDTAPELLHNIVLKYDKGKLNIVPGDTELRSTIRDNLEKLGEQPYEKLADDVAQDNGLRKEFAINLAVYYYSFGRNLVQTQQLFNKYYRYPDAKKVWGAFVKQLQYIKKDNDF